MPLEISVLALVGNVLAKRCAGTNSEEIVQGMKLFRPNAKVYLSSLKGSWSINDPNLPDERIQVVGQHRQSRQWIECWVRVSYVTNWRLQVVYKPGAVERLREAGWPGFALPLGAYELGADRISQSVVQTFLNELGKNQR